MLFLLKRILKNKIHDHLSDEIGKIRIPSNKWSGEVIKNIFASGKFEKDSVTEEISATASDGKIVKTDVVIAKNDFKVAELSDYIGCWWKRSSANDMTSYCRTSKRICRNEV